jgi:hypothetical protein
MCRRAIQITLSQGYGPGGCPAHSSPSNCENVAVEALSRLLSRRVGARGVCCRVGPAYQLVLRPCSCSRNRINQESPWQFSFSTLTGTVPVAITQILWQFCFSVFTSTGRSSLAVFLVFRSYRRLMIPVLKSPTNSTGLGILPIPEPDHRPQRPLELFLLHSRVIHPEPAAI